MTDANPLGTYLRDRRAKLDPTAFGFPLKRRRTPGLRREEVAQRANVSATWYTWLEQGRGGAPSADVLDRIARAMMLTDVEREHLFLLALGRPPEVRYRAPEGISPRLQRVLDTLECSPAFIRTAIWDVIAWKQPVRKPVGRRSPAYPVQPPVPNQPNGVLQLTSASRPPLNRLRQQWREKRPTFGAIATIPSIQTVQIMARSGLDWIIVDLEHGPIDLTSAHAMITATSGTSCVPLARIAANEPWLAKAPMDIGALGINFPMICSRQDAEKAVRSVRYPPRGERLWGPFHAPFRWGVSMADYMATADDDMICMVTIEHVEAVNRIDEIMATPGIDVAVIGPGDLATSIDKRGLIDDPEVQALMARAEAGILRSGVPIGGVARTAEQANQMIDRGYLALALGFDWSLFARGIAVSFEGIKR